ncbi:MAG: DUF4919 domain-containing protein [Altibacter sp.]|uniref:DUF4919 domain-containing protein n=1 Tax=Altibacter sp. TaxID=2024823 RepID=UPI001DE94986|nr:DUF4919 domain-containing protein [Altibacter sp.]MBZ0326479.1 DUF4919 domain-containing protein [Altibacter sp.]
MRLSIVFFLLFFSVVVSAQSWEFEKPDYKKIEKKIKDKKSNLFYESLMNRFKNADSTLTLEEKRSLYYGYSFQSEYSPYSHSSYSDSIRDVLQLKAHSKAELDKIIAFGDAVLAENPFDIRTLNYQLYALEKNGEQALFEAKVIQMTSVIDALMSSGDGMTKETSFYVIFTAHEYDLLNILGFEFGGSQSLIEHYDYLTLGENEYGIEGFYFDVSPCLDSMSKMLKE